MLSINNIEVVYDNVILVLKGVSLEVTEGAITTLLGANGAGKTTTLKAISGVLRTERGQVTKGSITLGGMVPPMAITPEDHEGGGWVQVWTVKGGKLVKDGEWFQAYRDVIKKHLAAIN